MKKDPKYARRLLKLAAFLEELPRKRFVYTSWVGDDWKGRGDLSCGTTGCALGWATTIPGMRTLGLRLRKLKLANLWTGEASAYGYVALKGSRLAANRWTANDRSIDAARRVFGLETGEVHRLFTADSGLPDNVSPRRVARHIRAFVKRETGKARA